MTSYFEPLKRGLGFAVMPLRWLPVFIVDMAFMVVLLGTLFSSPELILSLLEAFITPAAATDFSGLGALLVAGGVWFLARLWVTGAIIHQSYKEKEFKKSWKVSREKYFSLLGAIIVTIIVFFIAGLVPLIGSLLAVLAAMVLFYPLHSVMIRKSSAVNSLRDTYSIFRKSISFSADWRLAAWVVIMAVTGGLLFQLYGFLLAFGGGQGFFVSISGTLAFVGVLLLLLLYSSAFRAWLVISIISGLVTLVFAIPAFMLAASTIPIEAVVLGGSSLQQLLLHLLSNSHMLFASGAVFIVGSSIATAFALKAQTEFFLQFKKKRLGIF